ncbi:MAG: TA system VapC family ribonuclease toxin [Burkholderiales bacterium]
MSGVLLDVNLLIALAWPQHVHHSIAQTWFARASRHSWATCPLTQLAFVRISSNPKIIPEAVSPRDAAKLLKAVSRLPRHVFWNDDLSVLDLKLFESLALAGHRQVTDAYLLELVKKHDGRLATLDKGVAELISDPKERAARVVLVA